MFPLTRVMPPEATDAELMAARDELVVEAVAAGIPEADLWSMLQAMEDGSYTVIVDQRPAPWEW